MKLTFHGHAVLKIETNGKTIVIDPFITGNSQTDITVNELKPDYIILTHGHGDHFGDTMELAKTHDAVVIANADLCEYLFYKDESVRCHEMHIGGAFQFEFGKVKLTQAFHGSSINDNGQIIYAGMPAGILVMAEGKTIYHAGDTALFSDMKLIGDRHPIDVAFLPIGDNFTMGPEDAAEAVTFLHPKKVVPIHYNTFPVIKQNPQDFVDLCDEGMVEVLEAGQFIEL